MSLAPWLRGVTHNIGQDFFRSIHATFHGGYFNCQLKKSNNFALLFMVHNFKTDWKLALYLYLSHTLRGAVRHFFSETFFFKWIIVKLTNIRCSVKKKSPLLFQEKPNLQFKHFLFGHKKNRVSLCKFNFSHFFKCFHKILTNLRCSVKKKKILLILSLQHLRFKHFFSDR